ncbi:MAG: methionyl-tRNA formyltransferase [Patescibacteria group bacterium]|nr:methionyl-tRNA formyltransferase [Patescibacteria group bacterium]
MKKPLFAFFGTPGFGVHVLSALESHGLIPALVVTAPDKPRGRGRILSPSPVKTWALERGIEVVTPATLKDPSFIAELSNTDWDVFIVAAYGKLIPRALLTMPRGGALNIHPSLLPKLRGPSPARSAILSDMRETGVSIMQMSEEMDKGPVIAQARIEIAPEEWPPKGALLEELLATEGGTLLAETLPEWLKGDIKAEPQEESAATDTKKFIDEDARINLTGDPRKEFLKIQAFDESPRAHFFAHDASGKQIRVNILEAELRDSSLILTKVVPEGKREMSWEEFLRSGAKV